MSTRTKVLITGFLVIIAGFDMALSVSRALTAASATGLAMSGFTTFLAVAIIAVLVYHLAWSIKYSPRGKDEKGERK